MAITDLTGTKWKLNGPPSEYPDDKRVELFCAVESEDSKGVLRNYNFIEFGRWPGNPGTIPYFFTGETDSPGILRSISDNEWAYENTSSAYLDIVCYLDMPPVEITGGAGATDSDTIAWFEASATLIDPPATEPFLSKIGLSRVWQNIQTHLNKKQETLVSGKNIKTVNNQSLLGSGNVNVTPGQATEDTLGTVKLNTAQNVDLDADGKLVIGGRMGQFPTTTGLFAPNDREPLAVGNYSLLMTDAKGVNMEANRAMAVVSGLGLACKSAAAGTTEYRVNNTYANRIQAKMCEDGYIARDEATSTQQKIVKVLSVTINGSTFTPDSSANGGEIVIKTAETLNPDAAITNIRLFGVMKSYATLHVGNGVASLGGGRNLLLGGGVTKAGNSNDNCLVGNAIYSNGNGNACFGRWHIAAKNRGFFAGSGHDSTNAPSEGASAVGVYSSMSSNTLFAVGNGTSATNRSNAFEVTADGGIVLKSPNGTRYKLTVADDGTLSTTAL